MHISIFVDCVYVSQFQNSNRSGQGRTSCVASVASVFGYFSFIAFNVGMMSVGRPCRPFVCLCSAPDWMSNADHAMLWMTKRGFGLGFWDIASNHHFHCFC
jgi:hypothetical protein